MPLSIIIPVLNEAVQLERWLAHLRPLLTQGAEIIVVDGGSQDNSLDIARQWGAQVVSVPPSRGGQMNAGARLAQGDMLLFLHADTWLPADWDWAKMVEQLQHSGRQWGRFSVSIQGTHWMLPRIAWLINLRSCLTGIATGDQAIFVQQTAFFQVGGFPEQPLMEDVALSQRLLTLSPPLCLKERVITSGRRWEKQGVWQTIWLMWRLRWAYWRGVPASELAKEYRS